MRTQPRHQPATLGLMAILLVMAFQNARAQTPYAIDWSSLGGSTGISTGGIYSVRGAVGLVDSDLMHSASYTVAGNFGSGTVILPDAFYVGIDLQSPAQALADSDGDGLSDLMEFALGTDPHNPLDAARPLLLSATNNGGFQFMTMQFKRRNNASALGLQYLPEVSADGQTWYSDNAHVIEVSAPALDAQFDWVTVKDLTPASATAPRFVRLRIIQN